MVATELAGTLCVDGQRIVLRGRALDRRGA